MLLSTCLHAVKPNAHSGIAHGDGAQETTALLLFILSGSW